MKAKYIGATAEQIKWGGNDDPRGILTLGQEYEIERRTTHAWYTKYSLVEFPGQEFTGSFFSGAYV